MASSRHVGDHAAHDGTAAPVERAVDGEADTHERDQDRELGDPLDLRPDDDGVEAHPLGQRQQSDGHAEEEKHHRGRHGIPVEHGGEHRCEEHRHSGDEVDQVDGHDDTQVLLGVGLLMTYPGRWPSDRLSPPSVAKVYGRREEGR